GVSAAPVVIRQLVVLLAAVIGAEREVMQAVDPREALAEGARLVAVERVVAVREARIVGETQVGGPPVRSVLRGAGDAQLRRHIGAAGEIDRKELAIAAD